MLPVLVSPNLCKTAVVALYLWRIFRNFSEFFKILIFHQKIEFFKTVLNLAIFGRKKPVFCLKTG